MSINTFFMKDLLIAGLYLCYTSVKSPLVSIFTTTLRGPEETTVIVLSGVGGGEESFLFFRIMKTSSIRVRHSNTAIPTSIGMSEDLSPPLSSETSDIPAVVSSSWCSSVRTILIMFVPFPATPNACMTSGDLLCLFCHGKDASSPGKEWYGTTLSSMEFGESKL